jgi:radical SAM protein with 4Fe4S-binding SPASM domain
LDTKNWIDVIDQFGTMDAGNVVTFSGGEPLVYPQFDDIARHAKRAGHKVYLLTNGVALDRDRAQSLVGVVDSVQLSLEGTHPEIHDPIRGNGSFQRAVQGLKSLLECGFPVEVVFVVLPSNVSDLRDNLGDFVRSFDTQNLSVALGVVNFVGRAEDNFDDTQESLVGQVVDAYPDVSWLRKGSWESNRIVRGCPLANSVVVDADGKITTCPYLHYLSPHNIRHTALSDASSLDRAWHAHTIRLSAKCRTCDLRNFPCGGCMVRQTECSQQVFQRAYYRMVYGR